MDGLPLVRRAAIAAAGAGAAPVVVVVGAGAEAVAAALTGLDHVRTVVNHDWATGLASSLAAGLRSLLNEPALDGFLITLADQPHVNSPALRRLVSAFDVDSRIVAAAYGDVIGVPAVFGREHVTELLRITGDAGAGQWLRNRSSEVRRIPMDEAALDIDTAADAARLDGAGLVFAPASQHA